MSWFYGLCSMACILLSVFESGVEARISAATGLILVGIARVLYNQEEKP